MKRLRESVTTGLSRNLPSLYLCTFTFHTLLPKLGRASSRKTVLLSADEEETTLDLNMVQVGRLISDGAFNLEVGVVSK